MLVKDVLHGLLAVTPLMATNFNSATTTNGTEKNVASFPNAAAAILSTIVCPAAHTLTVTVEGRDEAADAWATAATFAQVTNANFATPQRVNIERPYKRYRTVSVTTGAFGANVFISTVVTLVGTNIHNAPITQVD